MSLESMVALVGGTVLIAIGGYSIRNPLDVRSYVSQRTWEQDPWRAEREQRARAQSLGGFAVVSGVVVFVVGLLATILP